MTTVRFLGAPVAAVLEVQDGLDGLQREVQLVALDGQAPLPDDVVDALVVARERFRDTRASMHRQARAAADVGATSVDIVVDYPDDALDDVLAIIAAARRAEVVAEEGALLSPPIGEAARRVREWIFAEAEAQLRGGDPSPYPGSAA